MVCVEHEKGVGTLCAGIMGATMLATTHALHHTALLPPNVPPAYGLAWPAGTWCGTCLVPWSRGTARPRAGCCACWVAGRWSRAPSRTWTRCRPHPACCRGYPRTACSGTPAMPRCSVAQCIRPSGHGPWAARSSHAWYGRGFGVLGAHTPCMLWTLGGLTRSWVSEFQTVQLCSVSLHASASLGP